MRVPRHVVYRDFPAETVVLNLETEQYHGLNPTAGRMLSELDRTGSLPETARAVADHYSRPIVEIERDLSALCDDLLARGLIEPAPDDR